MRYNSLILKTVYDVFGIVPDFVSTYEARKNAYPQLFKENNSGKKVLFGGYPRGCDKKHIIWEEVSKMEKNISWTYTRNGTLKKECYDMSDAYTCVVGHMRKENIW